MAKPGYVRKRGKTWQVTVELPPDPLTGERRRAYRTARTEKAAWKLAADLVTNGTPETDQRTVGELLAAWQAHIAADRSPSTMIGYGRKIDSYILPRLGKARVDRVRPVHLDDLYRTLRAEGGTDGGLSAQTVRHVHAILHAAFAQGRRWGWVTVNPAEDASPPPLDRQTQTPPSAEEVAKLYRAAVTAEDAELALLIWLAAIVGARRGELCGLRWSDWEGERLWIRRAIVVVGGELRVKATKKNKVHRSALDPQTVALLAAHRDYYTTRAAACDDEVSPDGYLLSPVPDGSEPMHPDVLGQRFIRLAAKAGIDCHLHLLRHWSATHALEAGFSARTVAGRLGQDPRTTLGIYAHALEASDTAAAEALARALSGT